MNIKRGKATNAHTGQDVHVLAFIFSHASIMDAGSDFWADISQQLLIGLL